MKIYDYANFDNITALSMEKYLLSNGWKRDYDFKNKNLMVFYCEKSRIAIPASEKFDDFRNNIVGILDRLSYSTGKDLNTLIKEINTSYVERLEFRVISSISKDGRLPFGYASNFMEGLKELILYSICAEQNNAPRCYKITSAAKEVLDNFKMAQTNIGSFIFNIETTSADENNEQLVLDQCEVNNPIEHNVIRRINKALNQIDSIVTKKVDIDDFIGEAYIEGITANMCDALLKLKPNNSDVNIETTFRYATALTRKSGSSDVAHIDNHHFYVIDEISKRYRELNEAFHTTLEGYIVSLKNDIKSNGSAEIASVISEVEGKLRTVKISLNDHYYRLACDAHRDGKMVKFSGTLETNKRTWEMKAVNNFEVQK